MKRIEGQQLPIPFPAQQDPRSREMIRAWIANNGLHVSLNVGMWEKQGIDEPYGWGIMLADVVRHVANALNERSGKDILETIGSIREEFLIELAHPTSGHHGKFARK